VVGEARCVGCRRRAGVLCVACAAELRPADPRVATPPLDRLLCALDYSGAARSLVLDLKLRGRRGSALPLAARMCDLVARSGTGARVITWVPGRPPEARRRGFDHAAVLARAVARRLGLPARPLLERVGGAADQTSLSAAERWANLEGAFVARPGSEPALVVDDLITTGATLSACGQALARAGCKGVEGLIACSAQGTTDGVGTHYLARNAHRSMAK
jgi:predicted amidophosphoribosyltransferase